MDDILKEVRGLRASELRTKLTSYGIDYNKENATTKEDLRKLLVKTLSDIEKNKAIKRKRKPTEANQENANKDNKRIVQAKISPERLDLNNRKIPLPQIKEGEKRKPPGMLAKLPVKQVFRTSTSRERTSLDKEMEVAENSDNDSSSSSQRLTLDMLNQKDNQLAKTVPNNPPSKVNPVERKRWDIRKTITTQDVDESRNKALEIKKAVIDREADLNAIKLKNLNEVYEKEQERLMEQKRSISREKHSSNLNSKLNSSSNSNDIFSRANRAMHDKNPQEKLSERSNESSISDPKISEESYKPKSPLRNPNKIDNKSSIRNNIIKENRRGSSSSSHHSSVKNDRGPTRRKPTERETLHHRSSSSESEEERPKNRGLTSNTGFIFSGNRNIADTEREQPSIVKPITKTVTSNFGKFNPRVNTFDEPKDNTNLFVRTRTTKTRKSWTEFFNDKCSLPVIIFLVIIATMMLMKGTHIVYNKYLEYDNVLFCPSDIPIPTTLPENSTKKEQDFYDKMKNCTKCPTNGFCSRQGATIKKK